MSRATQIQQLYIGLLGRAADPVGLDYWVNNGLTIDEIAANIVNEQDEFSFNEEQRQAAVEALYQNLFGRPGTAEDVNYWTNESLTPIDQLLFTMIEGAGTNDATALTNRTFVADAYTKAAAETGNFNKEAAAEVIAKVDHTTKSVSDALDTIDGAGIDLTASLAELLAAQAAVGEFVAAWGEENDVAGAGVADVLAATGLAEGQIAGYPAAGTDAQKAAFLASERADLAADLEGAQDDLAESTEDVADVAGLKTGIDRFIAAFGAAQAAALAAVDAEAARDEAFNAAETYFIALDPTDTDSEDYLVTSATGISSVSKDATVAAFVGAGLSQAQATAYVAALNALAAASNVAAGAQKSADDAEALAQTRLDTIETIDDDYVAQAVDLDDSAEDHLADIAADYAVDAVAVSAAQKAINDFEGLVARLEAAQADADELQVLLDNLDDAVDNLGDAGYVVELPGLDTNGDGDLSDNLDFVASDDSDVYVLTPALRDAADFNNNGTIDSHEYADITIDNFGFLGSDAIYAAGWSLGEDIKAGDNSVLEFFITQDGANTVLTFETVEFGSNAAEQEAFTITLTGVAANDVVFADGYITVA